MKTPEMPKAVSDYTITADGGPVTQPVEVRRAVRLLWCSLAIAIVTMLINETVRRAEPHPPGLAPVFIGLSALIATFSAMVVGIARGRNWVRLLMLFVVAGGGIYLVVRPGYWLSMPVWRSAEYLLQCILQSAAVCLTFSRNAQPWYRRYRT
jgi:hypothetical protein